MKKLLLTLLCVVTFFGVRANPAAAIVNDTVKVGLRYGGAALFSANLENAVGSGYAFGWFDSQRSLQELGWTEETAISMTAAGTIYMTQGGTYSENALIGGYATLLGPWHVQLDGFRSYEAARETAARLGGYPAWINGAYAVRVGCYESAREAETAAERLGEGYAVSSSTTGVLVTVTRTDRILFEFDEGGRTNLAVEPQGRDTETWFKGYKYPGSFEYQRAAGGNLTVMNLVDLEQYVKGVIPYEMNPDWPLAALEAQAVCARTYACRTTSHADFDVCASTCCQVYYGTGSGGASPSAVSDRAVDNTAGELLYYQGALVQNPVYHSSNGGATEDGVNVWGGRTGYLLGKQDPYESQTTIPNYEWSVTYTAEELTWILDQKGYSVGTVRNVYVSEYTPMGNVKAVTFEGSRDDLTVTGETCRTIFYSSTYGKSAKSMRFSINGGGPAVSGSVYVNGSQQTLTSLEGVSVISGQGSRSTLSGASFTVLTSTGASTVGTGSGSAAKPAQTADGRFTLTGTGSGHNLGLSQYGAKAMAELGYRYDEILTFYFTGVTIG